jgi:NAD(P)-dependent dehydrogenase (short-subunit alcohol dehydrogenase family)
MRFTEKVCVVTGGASGIGRATCSVLAAEGGRVALVDVEADGGLSTAKSLGDKGHEAMFVAADVAVAHDVRAAVDGIVGRWGHIDVLVNCAARMSFDPVVDLADEAWDAVLATNLRSVFLWSKYGLPHMPAGGSVVNVSSVHAHRSTPNVAPYAASKGGMEAFTRVLAQECEAQKIRVNCVAPGAVDTPMLWSNPLVRSGQEKIDGRIGSPEDVAASIAFLASDAARFVTGAVLAVDGGRLTKL